MNGCYFDSHAHYDHALFDGQGAVLLQQLFDEGLLCGAVIPAISYDTNFHREMFPSERFPQVYYAPGLHPKYALNTPAWTKKERSAFMTLLEQPNTVAVKTGLDFHHPPYTAGQKRHEADFFRLFIRIANEKNLPLVLHIRDAAEETIEVLTETPLQVPAVAHCATFDADTTKRLMAAGITHFGIGGKVTQDAYTDLQEAVRWLPMEAILLETDAPFVKPKGWTESVNTSAALPQIAHIIADLKGLSPEEVAQRTKDNALAFFGLG